MLNYHVLNDAIATDLTGKALMAIAQLNKGTAFSIAERSTFGLMGKLPPIVETLTEQVNRAYLQFSRYQTDMQKHIYLNNLHDRNQVLFYRLVLTHLEEMIPLIYTPCIGTAVQQFSHEFRQARGLFISYEDRHHLSTILANRSNPDIDIIVVTDGEGILGIGDQGIGGINIPIAKLMIYTLFAGINPLRTLPIYLDVGTNNPALLNDPFYLGRRHTRLNKTEYDNFIDQFTEVLQQKFPKAFLHWEDFGRENAHRILLRYREQLCHFNDDIQGTGAVTLAALLTAVKKTHSTLDQQRIVIFGAGTAGAGIVEQIYQALLRMGIDDCSARQQFWLVDRYGLLLSDDAELTPAQRHFARDRSEVVNWQANVNGQFTLAETVQQVKPTILIGCSTQGGAFNEALISNMACHTAQPIIFPLSNPTDHSEATPEQLLQWTAGKALIATGSPFAPVVYHQKVYPIAQCNNALIFPGIGLGVNAVQAKYLTDDMLWAACQTLSNFTGDSLLPSLLEARQTALAIAVAVAQQAIKENVAQRIIQEDLTTYLTKLMWQPDYLPLKKISSVN